MKQEFLAHKTAYLILITGLVVCTVLFLAVWPDHWLQRLVALGLATFYAGWGILTHLHHQSISRTVVYEYLAVSGLAIVLLFLVTA